MVYHYKVERGDHYIVAIKVNCGRFSDGTIFGNLENV